MEATYHLNPGELTDDFLKAIQLLFRDQYVKVTVEVEDSGETDAIRSNTALHEKLVRRMKNVENGLVREVDSNKLVNDASADI